MPEPGYYAPEYTDLQRRADEAWDDEFDSIKDSCKTMAGALNFVIEELDADNILAAIFVAWANGESPQLNSKLSGLLSGAATARVEKRFS